MDAARVGGVPRAEAVGGRPVGVGDGPEKENYCLVNGDDDDDREIEASLFMIPYLRAMRSAAAIPIWVSRLFARSALVVSVSISTESETGIPI